MGAQRHVLQARGLACGYGSRAVLQGLDLTFESGQTLCLLGPNGVGKTTLFKTLLGFLKPLAGTLTCDGEDITRWSRRRYGTMFGYIPQTHASAFNFTVSEMVLLGRTPALSGVSQHVTADDRRLAQEAMEALGIAHLAERDCSQLSGGEMQMVLCARALAQQPAFLVMDEPTSSLDLGNQVRVLEQVSALGERGLGVIMTTHDPNQAFLLDGEVLCVLPGAGFLGGSVREVLTRDTLSSLYGVPVGISETVSPGGVSYNSCVPFLSGRREREVAR